MIFYCVKQLDQSGTANQGERDRLVAAANVLCQPSPKAKSLTHAFIVIRPGQTYEEVLAQAKRAKVDLCSDCEAIVRRAK